MRKGFLSYLLISVVFGSVCGAELQVNTHTAGEQRNADIAVDSLGSFVVVWSSYLQDGSSNGVFAQRFDPNFIPAGEEYPVNTTTVGNQTEPAVAMDAEGNFPGRPLIDAIIDNAAQCSTIKEFPTEEECAQLVFSPNIRDPRCDTYDD